MSVSRVRLLFCPVSGPNANEATFDVTKGDENVTGMSSFSFNIQPYMEENKLTYFVFFISIWTLHNKCQVAYM